MHETSLGGTLADYLTGKERERTTYEELRQALARFLVEEKGYPKSTLVPRFPVRYLAGADEHVREADIAVVSAQGEPRLLVLFCPGQVHTYARELLAMCRLSLPTPSPLGVVTDMKDAELLGVQTGAVLARGLKALPLPDELDALAAEHPISVPGPEQRDREGRILHAYTGFLKTCCGESCSL